MIAVDTNILVYAHRSMVPQHRRAQRAIERAYADRRGWGIAFSTVGEFWSVVTHPSATGRPSTPAEASAFIDSLVEQGGMRIWLPHGRITERLLKLATDLQIGGVRIFDLQIALTVLDNGAKEIWTHDSNFVRVPGVWIRDPLID